MEEILKQLHLINMRLLNIEQTVASIEEELSIITENLLLFNIEDDEQDDEDFFAQLN